MVNLKKQAHTEPRTSDLILEAMDWCRDSSLSVDECLAAVAIDWHHWCVAEKPAEFNCVPDILALYRDDSDCSCLLVDHSYCSFVSDDT